MSPSGRREPSSEALDPLTMALAPLLHRAHDAILQEPLPKDLLIASGIGSAHWGTLREEWGSNREEDRQDRAGEA